MVDPLLLVLNKHEDTMSYVDPATLAVVATAPAGHDPHELVIRADRRLAFISNYAPPGNTVAVVDLVERRLVTLILTEPYTRIHGAAMEPGGRFGYFTAGQTGYLVEVDLTECRVSRAIETHGEIATWWWCHPTVSTW